ncbi:MAG: hypothetical protein GC159_21635 [Phycisphaera sp.]|nr:hypothetical protein [Phycisphaera sp.]
MPDPEPDDTEKADNDKPNIPATLSPIVGVAGFLCFGVFNINVAAAKAAPGSPYLSAVLGLMALATGAIALAQRPRVSPADRTSAWIGVACGFVMFFIWLGIALLARSEPM